MSAFRPQENELRSQNRKKTEKKFPNPWNNLLQNNTWAKEKISRNIKKTLNKMQLKTYLIKICECSKRNAQR